MAALILAAPVLAVLPPLSTAAAAETAAHSANPVSLPFKVSLYSTDPAMPLQMLGENGWFNPHAREAVAPNRDITGERVKVATFTFDGSRGPANLVVDLAGFADTTSSSSNREARVEVSVFCLEHPLKCVIPHDKGVMYFRERSMRTVKTKQDGQDLVFLYGRNSHSYNLPVGEPIRLEVVLVRHTGINPAALKAWAFYGENANPDLAMSDERVEKISRAAAGFGLALLMLGIWWRRRQQN